MSLYSTTVRMLHSGLVLHDSKGRSDPAAAQARHDQLVDQMMGVVRGTQTGSRCDDGYRSTIFVGNRALIEVTTS